MSDLTVYAEALIATVARAFYDDDVVCLIDVLIRDKFLRDDDMAPRLSLPARRLRSTLQFLQEEHLVGLETVDDLAQGGSQATKFYYLDYNRAVHSIRLRLHLLRKRLEKAELRARSSSFYLCPGYELKRCNGRYTEEDAQHVLDQTTGLFLCQECSRLYENDPHAPSLETYTLQLVDNTKELKEAMDNLRRVNVQLSTKFIGNHQMRAGVYDLLSKVRGKGKSPITSNLPSENFALGIGSKRLAGTGRTAGIKAKKLEQQGVAASATQAQDYLVGGSGARSSTDEDLIFLKNAMGHEIQFSVERGGGARAQLLATRKRRLRKLMDAAASRVGVTLPLHVRLQREENRKRKLLEEDDDDENDEAKKKKKKKALVTLEFLYDNIGRLGVESPEDLEENGDGDEKDKGEEEGPTEENADPFLADETTELCHMSDEKRVAAFQAQYKVEVDRQMSVVGAEMEEEPPVWEDGDM